MLHVYYMHGTILYVHWNIYEMYNFSMQWQIIFFNFLFFNIDVTCILMLHVDT
jgi:hypothetical protein